MKTRLRIALMILLSLAALRSGIGAYKSLRPLALSAVPEDIYYKYSGRDESAAYCLKSCDGYVAVYAADRPRTPLNITVIETACLRSIDRAMLDRGIPVETDDQLLELLEDLGS